MAPNRPLPTTCFHHMIAAITTCTSLILTLLTSLYNTLLKLKGSIIGPTTVYIVSIHDFDSEPSTHQVLGIFSRRQHAAKVLNTVRRELESDGRDVLANALHPCDSGVIIQQPKELDGTYFRGAMALILQADLHSSLPDWLPQS